MLCKCQITGEEFEVTEQELGLLEKMGLKVPIYSPKIREVMRMAHRNDRNLYMRKCDATGEKILSVYKEGTDFPVYKYDYWVSDKWDVPSLDYDFEKPFFEQYGKLKKMTPRVNIFGVLNENCDYVNAAAKNKNCYMHILSDRSEDCYYTNAVFVCKDCLDIDYCHECELCYWCVDCRNCYHCRSCFLSDNCSDCSFCFDCRGSRDCFMSSGLRNQQYVFENEQLNEKEYKTKIASINLGSYGIYNDYKEKFYGMIKDKDYVRMVNTENSDGGILINTKNCHKCFDLEDAEDCFYVRVGANGIKDVHHSYSIVDGSELIYGNISTCEGYNSHNVIGCWLSRDCAYCNFVQSCTNCIGCISLKYKKNCILNKEYSPDEFEEIKRHIIQELGDYWGSPMPIDLADFDYQDSVYRDYHEMSKEEVEKIGWVYGEERKEEVGEYVNISEIPDEISDFSDDDLSKIYKGEGRAFKIIGQELKLLKKIEAPLSRRHHEERLKERVRFRKTAEKINY